MMWQWLACAMAIGTAQAADFRTVQSRLDIHSLDVGYADAHLLVLKDAGRPVWAALIDAGASDSSEVIAAALERTGIRTLDAFILTHPHPNHYEGLAPLLKKLSIRSVFWPGAAYPVDEFMRWVKLHSLPTLTPLFASAGWNVHPDLRLRPLHPPAPAQDIHQDGLVLLVIHGRNGFLFPGDLSPASQPRVQRSAEAALADEGARLQWIAWPHHGDTLDTSWLKWAEPVPWWLISVGPNVYDLPKDVLLLPPGATIWRTDRQGSFHAESDGNHLKVDTP